MQTDVKRVILVAGCWLLVAGLSGCLPKQKIETPVNPGSGLEVNSPTKTLSSTEVVLEGRPYVVLIPRADGKGITLKVTGIINAKSLEYELVYLAGDSGNQLQRGVVGSVELEGKTDYTKSLLLGTCSRNVCKYDENVSEGTLILTFRDEGGAVQKYESVFRLQKGKEGKEGLTTGNGNFKFVSQNLSPSVFYITSFTVGLFQMPTGKVITGPHGIFTAGSSKASGEVTLKLPNPSQNAKIILWDGKKWNELESIISSDNLSVSANTSSLGTFVVVEE